MATAPVKSQPLHNFSLPHLRWATKNHHNHSSHSSHHRFRRRVSPDLHQSGGCNLPSSSQSEGAAAATADSDADYDDSSNATTAKPSSSRTPRKVFHFSPCSSRPVQHLKDGAASEKVKDERVEDDDTDAKPWKLRPRKALHAPSFKKGGKMQDETVGYQKNESCEGLKSARLAVPAPGSERQRKVLEEKRRLWISLSREEIEEDVYSMTQSKPARRPRKRQKNVQKQLDNVFPGLYLVGMTADSYRIHESLK